MIQKKIFSELPPHTEYSITEQGRTPVSYTHLDVYKRQVRFRGGQYLQIHNRKYNQ